MILGAARWRWLPLASVFAVGLVAAQLIGPAAERGLLALALLGALAALWPWGRQRAAGPVALALLAAAVGSLALRFLTDDFSTHLVWSLSAPQLAPWLKVANLWAGDEGTLLLLGTIGLALALRLDRYGGWAGPGAYALAAVFILGALLWDPFRPTAAAALAEAPYRGMNAHLSSPWMAVHPPLVFFAYLVLAAPFGAMAEALALGRGAWRRISFVYARGAWLLLSLGIGFGMWWAYEDFTYGTLWHWDPVQTAIFASWAFLTAALHAQKRYRPDGAFGVVHPALGLLAAASVLLAMAVTRSPGLASSHRYLGETSLPLLLGIAGALAVVLFAALAVRFLRGPLKPEPGDERRVLIWIAIVLFALCGLVALVQLGLAFWSEWQGLSRPASLKPFFETLRNFAAGSELAELRAAFAQWDVDNFALNAWLLPLLCGLGLAGGHYYLPLAGHRRWLTTFAVLALGAVTSLWLRPAAQLFEGRGLTSGKTVALFPWIDFLAVALAYLVLAVLAWSWIAARRGGWALTWRHGLPFGLIHAGMALALFGGLAATVFDSYAQRVVSLPEGLSRPIDFPGGYRLEIDVIETGKAADGIRTNSSAKAFRSVAWVQWSLRRDGRTVSAGTGHAVYRDERPPYSSEVGAVRLMCEMIDYRYARYVSGSEQMMHPLISRGLFRDVQIWVPAVSGPPTAAQEDRLAVVLKVFPLMSLVWTGLIAAGCGFAILLFAERRHGRA